MRKSVFVAVALAGAVAFATAGLASRQEPKKANKFQSTLVGAYDKCTTPNDTTGGTLTLPACEPASYQGGVCGIDIAKGGGKVLAKEKNGDVDLKIKMKGLLNCDGTVLSGLASFRATTNDCAVGSDCTTVDQTDLPLTIGQGCVVANGKCQIKTSVNTAVPGTITPGNLTNVTVQGCALGLPGGTIVARCGVLIP